jgi:uncharacterized membrane protein YdjX (TVP38/TMEM64 family)
MLPTSFFEMAVGYSFGFHRALMITWVAKSIGGVLSFMLGRTLLRDHVSKLLQESPLARALTTTINDKSLIIITLVRVAYIPMAVKNYGLSICPGLNLCVFATVSSLVNLPYSIMWAFWGSQMQYIGEQWHPHPIAHLVFLVIAICATGLLVILGFHWTARLYSSMELVPLAAEADEQNSTSDPPEVV